MVSFRLFVAGRSVDPDPRHYRCLLPHLEACRMADAALSGVGGVRGVSESGGVVAEPVKEFQKTKHCFIYLNLFNLIAKGYLINARVRLSCVYLIIS